VVDACVDEEDDDDGGVGWCTFTRIYIIYIYNMYIRTTSVRRMWTMASSFRPFDSATTLESPARHTCAVFVFGVWCVVCVLCGDG
jgi:hypothetical protein